MSQSKSKGYYMILQPCDLAAFYTVAQLLEKITAIETAITSAQQSMQDTFGDTQATQTVKRQSLEKLRDELAVYIKAYNLKTGSDCSTADLIAAKYNPSLPRI